jgi:hypothetical protein
MFLKGADGNEKKDVWDRVGGGAWFFFRTEWI